MSVCPPFASRRPGALAVVIALLVFVGVCPQWVRAADLMEGYRAVQRGDYARAHAEFEPLVRLGDVNAMIQVAHLYAEGLGVAKNEAVAISLYRAALLRIAAERAEPPETAR